MSTNSHVPQAQHLMDTQGHTNDKLLAMELLTVGLLARVLLRSIVLVIVELRCTHVSHDVIWQIIQFLQCTTWPQWRHLQMLSHYHLAEGMVISCSASQCPARCGRGKQSVQNPRIRLNEVVDCQGQQV